MTALTYTFLKVNTLGVKYAGQTYEQHSQKIPTIAENLHKGESLCICPAYAPFCADYLRRKKDE